MCCVLCCVDWEMSTKHMVVNCPQKKGTLGNNKGNSSFQSNIIAAGEVFSFSGEKVTGVLPFIGHF